MSGLQAHRVAKQLRIITDSPVRIVPGECEWVVEGRTEYGEFREVCYESARSAVRHLREELAA